MHPYFFFLLLSSGVSSYFLPPKEMPHLQNETKYSLIDEMLCLLEAENDTINEMCTTPLFIEKPCCAHNNTEIFIQVLKNISSHTWKCVKKVEKGMQELKNHCCILKKSPSTEGHCSKAGKRFPVFKESLTEFLKWVNQNLKCSNLGRSELGLDLDGKCTCRAPWKFQQGLG